jgi:hypothetical protein
MPNNYPPSGGLLSAPYEHIPVPVPNKNYQLYETKSKNMYEPSSRDSPSPLALVVKG